MRTIFALASLSVAVAFGVFIGCGDGGPSETTTGTTTEPTGTTGTSTTSMTPPTTTTSMPPSCTGILDGSACAKCTEDKCCSLINDCLDDIACKNCLQFPPLNPMDCVAEDLYINVVLCGQQECADDCTAAPCDATVNAGSCFALGPTDECNPFTNEPCNTAAGETCVPTSDGAFICYDSPNQASVCGECDYQIAFCDPGTVCIGVCTPYCCDDSDCASGACAKGAFPNPSIGFCVSKPVQIPCVGDPDGVCEPGKEICACSDCVGTAYCNKDQCTDDGVCDILDSCTCADCDDNTSCICDFNGACDSFKEGCTCPDCWDEPNCADNPKEPCTDDGVCGNSEWCSCVDCKDTGFCLDTNHCANDGQCQAYEGCVCADCMAEPGCQ